MIVNLKGLEKNAKAYEIRLSDQLFQNVLQASGLRLNARANDIIGVINLKLSGLRLNARVVLETKILLQCVRCLSEFLFDINESYDFVYMPANMAYEGAISKNIELKEQDMNIGYYNEGSIDAYNIIIEAINLSIPLNPVCLLRCEGLCQSCGANLNTEKCKCE